MEEFGEIVKGIEYLKRPGSYGVIIKDGRIGVVKSSVYNKYFLIGGGIENGEDEIAALRREAIEEIGFEIETGEKIGKATEYFYAEKDKQYIAKECNFYRVAILNKSADKAESELIWIGQNRLGELYHKSHRWIIEKELETKSTKI
jgi:8-oxo-dGTP diphosphatase